MKNIEVEGFYFILVSGWLCPLIVPLRTKTNRHNKILEAVYEGFWVPDGNIRLTFVKAPVCLLQHDF